jgi:endo-beta-N-acetylglucosaminidase D
MLTIPPPAYIKVAHENGVKILGTLIFEWEKGSKSAN